MEQLRLPAGHDTASSKSGPNLKPKGRCTHALFLHTHTERNPELYKLIFYTFCSNYVIQEFFLLV